MKKLFVLVICVGALALAGCSNSDTPENFGKNYIQKKFENMNCDLESLNYTIKNKTDTSATVIIEGKIKYKEEIQLVRENDDWAISKKDEVKPVDEKPEQEEQVK